MKNTNKNSRTVSKAKSTSASKTSLSRGALMLSERMNSYADDESKVRYGCRLFISGKKLMATDMKATYKCVTDGDNATLDDVNNAGWLMYRMAGLLEYPRCLEAYSVWFDYDSPEAFRKDFENLFSVLRPVVERIIDENTDWEKLRASLRK